MEVFLEEEQPEEEELGRRQVPLLVWLEGSSVESEGCWKVSGRLWRELEKGW